MRQIHLPKQGPSIAKQFELGTGEKNNLIKWGFDLKLVGSLAERVDKQSTYCWAGGFTKRDEAPVLTAITPDRRDYLVNAAWFYGIVTLEEVQASPQPVTALLDASVHSATADNLYVDGFRAALFGLSQILPISLINA